MCDLDKLYIASTSDDIDLTLQQTVPQAIRLNKNPMFRGKIVLLWNPGEALHYVWNEANQTFDPVEEAL